MVGVENELDIGRVEIQFFPRRFPLRGIFRPACICVKVRSK